MAGPGIPGNTAQPGGGTGPDGEAGPRAERAIQATTIVAVVAVAAVAAFVSYRHMRGVALEQGEDRLAATVIPFSVDGLIVAASMTMLRDRRAGRPRSWLSYTLLTLGACASLAANVMHAEPTLAARIIAGWPPLALLGSYELLMRQIHAGRGTAGGRRSADIPITVPAQRGEQLAARPAVHRAAPASPSSPGIPADGVGTASTAGTAGTAGIVTRPDTGINARPPAGILVAGISARPAENPGEAGKPNEDKSGAEHNGPVPISMATASASLPVTLTALDAAGKRDAIVRALEQTGGAATDAVALLAAQGVKVSRSWVYQVRKDTRHHDADTVSPALVATTKSD
ncbi:hypothetical protein BL254_18870 [Protofrankia sp. BMG5.30]|nr:hypothetical protein BL254_18870 [Protofrankia sp. BMG5.30]